MLPTRLCRHAHTCGLTYCTVGMPAARKSRARPKLNSGASMPTNTSGRRGRIASMRARSRSKRGRSPQNLEQTHDRERLGRLPAFTARGQHFRSRHAEELCIRREPLQRLDQCRAERITGRFAGHQAHAQGARIA